MATQEERLSNLEKITALLQERLNEEGVRELNRDVTMLLGLATRSGSDMREMKAVLARLEGKVSILDRGLDRVEEHMGSMEQRLSSIDTILAEHTERFDAVNMRLDTQDKKLDQMLLLLTALAPKPNQEA